MFPAERTAKHVDLAPVRSRMQWDGWLGGPREGAPSKAATPAPRLLSPCF